LIDTIKTIVGTLKDEHSKSTTTAPLAHLHNLRGSSWVIVLTSIIASLTSIRRIYARPSIRLTSRRWGCVL